MAPEAIFLSNGPGDPAAVERGIAAVSDLVANLRTIGASHVEPVQAAVEG